MVRSGGLAVKSGFHAAGNLTFLPIPAALSSGAISSPEQGALGYLWVPSLIVASPGHHTQFTYKKYPIGGLR